MLKLNSMGQASLLVAGFIVGGVMFTPIHIVPPLAVVLAVVGFLLLAIGLYHTSKE